MTIALFGPRFKLSVGIGDLKRADQRIGLRCAWRDAGAQRAKTENKKL
ncbi:MAG: hypothetical protein H7Z14_02375 [Anaerolineae bacterium]|nr:hypothetical protein [Phycisphaerae bacterium]